MTSFIEPNMFDRVDLARCAGPVTSRAAARVTFKKNSKVHSA